MNHRKETDIYKSSYAEKDAPGSRVVSWKKQGEKKPVGLRGGEEGTKISGIEDCEILKTKGETTKKEG